MAKSAHHGATSKAIFYLTCGWKFVCGSVSYGNSAKGGIVAVASAVNSFNSRCSNTQLFFVSYSQVNWFGSDFEGEEG
jgi:acetylxylan esterase